MYTDLLDKGYASLRRGDPDAALIRFRHAAESEPERPQAYFGMAMVYLEKESSDEVVVSLEKALGVDPSYVAARAYLGIEYLKRYDIVKAEEELERALKDEPTNLLAHLKYAEYYYRLGFYNRSVEVLERGLKQRVEHVESGFVGRKPSACFLHATERPYSDASIGLPAPGTAPMLKPHQLYRSLLHEGFHGVLIAQPIAAGDGVVGVFIQTVVRQMHTSRAAFSGYRVTAHRVDF